MRFDARHDSNKKLCHAPIKSQFRESASVELGTSSRNEQHGMNFAKVSKNLVATYKSQNNFIHQNNYVGRSSWLLKFCFLQHCLSYLSFLHNYVDDPKLALNMYENYKSLEFFMDPSINSRCLS